MVGNNETTPLWPDSHLGKFTKASENRISETISVLAIFVNKNLAHPGFPGLFCFLTFDDVRGQSNLTTATIRWPKLDFVKIHLCG